MTTTARSWLSRPEVLERLGVKPQTLYAYVSRGRIAARPDPDNPRRSLYAAEDVGRLLDRTAQAARRTARDLEPGAARGEAVVESALTSFADDKLWFRGKDAAVLAETATLEQAARHFWDGEEDPFADLKPRVDVVFPGGPRGRAFAALARRADEDAPSAGRSARSLRREAAAVLSELVDAVAAGGSRPALHLRLARAWKLTDRDAELLRRALVLSLDHGLNEASLAVRVTASTGASLAACALSGLAALSGPRFAGKLALATGFVAEARRGADARAAARQRLAQGLEIPGFGHPLHPGGDPRARALLAAATLPEELTDVMRVGEGLTGEAPNFDMALALLGRHLDLPKDGAFTLYAIGRTVGFTAHALEQIAAGSPVRARLRYVGSEPDHA